MEKDNTTIYIEDLLNENKKLFAFNEDVQQKRKELKHQLLDLCDSYGTTDDFKKMACLCGRIVGMAMVYRQNLKDIRKNKALIEGLRNGTIKEI